MVSRKSHKSLGLQLSELANTQPKDFDPESFGDDSISKYQDSDSDIQYSDEDELKTTHYLDVGSSKIRKDNELTLDDEEQRYQGKKTSRKDLYEDDDGFSSANEMLDEEGDSSEEEEIEHSNDSVSEDDEDEKLQMELLSLQNQEKELYNNLSQNALANADKGVHVRNQMALYDKFLDSRIRIQSALTIGNTFPQFNNFNEFVDDESKPLIQEANDETTELIGDLIDLRKTLITKNSSMNTLLTPHIKPINKQSRKRSSTVETLTDLWEDMSSLDVAFDSYYRDDTIEKWNKKINMGNKGSLGNKNLKIVNQSTLTQIKSILTNDPERLIKRTRLSRTENHSVIGKENIIEQEDDENPHLNAYDQEIFDDQDFYTSLLKEFIENKLSTSTTSVPLKPLKKTKKKVDTKASKGRKIRYNVQEKLLNFMSAIPFQKSHSGNDIEWHADMSRELFAGLFGKDAAVESSKNGIEDGGLRIFN